MLKKLMFAVAGLALATGSAVAAEIPDGEKLFGEHCAKCHGSDGSVSERGRKLEPFPARNLRAIAPYASTDELRRIITHGMHRTKMKPMKYELDALEIEAVVDYIKTFDYEPDLTNGRERYGKVCASCHGVDGYARTGLGARNLVYSKLELPGIVHTIRYGRPGTLMTAKRHQLSNTDIADIASYVYSLRYSADPELGEKLYANHCESCHETPGDIRIIGNAAARKTLADLDNHMIDLRIRHGRHIERAGRGITELSGDDVQDIIAYMKQEMQ